MIALRRNYDDVYQDHAWAYGAEPDFQLINALDAISPGPAVDIGGGQGRHAIALARMGYRVELVDSSMVGLSQAAERAEPLGLEVKTVAADIGSYRPAKGLHLAVAALTFHLPALGVSLDAAKRLGEALRSGGLLYISLPGFDSQTRQLAVRLMASAKCTQTWLIKHIVTPQERPRLPVPRRNETRVLAVKQ